MENSKIEWCDHTFNPWIGCTKVSPGCQHCYAENLMDTRWKRVQWGPSGQRVRTSEANWRKPLAWDKKAWKQQTRRRVFCASLADIFEEKNDQPEIDQWRWDLFRLIEQTKNLDWLLLTKRPENVNVIIERCTWASDSEMWLSVNQNVWIGTSVENQEQANKRIPELAMIPAKVRFLSMEPLLERVDIGFGGVLPEKWKWVDNSIINWVIVGGESGHNARPMKFSWVIHTLSHCINNDVPFFFKQWGEYNRNGELVGKKQAGRLLLDQEWNGIPS